MKTAAIYALLFLCFLLGLQIINLANRLQHTEHPCFCDTCCESHYEAIRTANPSANLPAIEE